jgi:hypothetical protein
MGSAYCGASPQSSVKLGIIRPSIFICLQARKLEEHRRKYERRRAEKEMKEKLERARRAREEHEKAAKNAGPQADADGSGGAGMGDFYQFLNDPEIMQAFQVRTCSLLWTHRCSVCTAVNIINLRLNKCYVGHWPSSR